MKILTVNGKVFQADKIIKTDTDIIGEDTTGKEIFAFRGITDFSQFTLSSGETFDKVQEQLNQEKIDLMQKAIDDLILGGAS